MHIKCYQALAMRTSTETHDRILNGCMGLIGESGEVIDAVKKWKFQSGDHALLPKDKLIDECGDVLWYCAELATGFGDKLHELYDRHGQDFYNDMHDLNTMSPIEILAGRLCAVATRPFTEIYDSMPVDELQDIESWESFSPEQREAALEAWKRSNAKADIVGIMTTVRDFLEIHCDSTLEEAMDRNIEKLRRRYPDGFDPERSLHREGE